MLVNNAGVATHGPFVSTPGGRERDLLRLNVEAVVALTRGLLPAMLESRRGGVINVASQMAFQPMPYFAVYAASVLGADVGGGRAVTSRVLATDGLC